MRILAASSLLFAAPLMAQQSPEVEPNDTVAQAQVVALGSQINGNLTAGNSTGTRSRRRAVTTRSRC
jgi:hypothetical protein